MCVTAADFFFTDQTLSLVTCDEEGIMRMYEYDPHGLCFHFFLQWKEASAVTEQRVIDPESKNGLRLMCRTEFHGQIEYRASVAVARRSKSADPGIPQSKLVCGMST